MGATFQGVCFHCGNTMSVRLVAMAPTGVHAGQSVQACYDCRPAGTIAPTIRSFAVLVGRIPYLVKAGCRAEAEGLLSDELEAVNEAPETTITWGAESSIYWLAAWRRKDTIIIENRKLPADLA